MRGFGWDKVGSFRGVECTCYSEGEDRLLKGDEKEKQLDGGERPKLEREAKGDAGFKN